jgi:hypothetical protein
MAAWAIPSWVLCRIYQAEHVSASGHYALILIFDDLRRWSGAECKSSVPARSPNHPMVADRFDL